MHHPEQGKTSAPHTLRCDYRADPMGLDTARPGLSWRLSDGRRGAVQSAYRVLVAPSEDSLNRDRGALWDSGKIRSDNNIHIPYGGKPLQSRQRCFWKVRTWDAAGEPSPWSDTARWEMGLLERKDWRASWIGFPGQGKAGGKRPGGQRSEGQRSEGQRPCPCLRRDFTLAAPPVRGRIYATALGAYILYINGQPVSSDRFAPGWTDYRKRVSYRVYDVTGLLQEGDNTVAALLGDGWFCGHLGLTHENWYGDRPRLLCQLECRFESRLDDEGVGPVRTVVKTDRSWRVAEGPVRASDFFMGETYDARREMPGWNAPGFNDQAWKPARLFPRRSAVFTAHPGPPVRKQVEMAPMAVTEPAPGCRVFDLGQNGAGWVRLKVKGRRGTRVTLRFGEMLDSQGMVYTENLRTANCTDTYILKGGGEECYEPHFTYHGFRYVEVKGYPGKAGLDAVTGVVAHSDMAVTGSFACSNPMVNRLQENILWSQRGNFVEVPTDCPQRDERLGWTGDAQIFMGTACFNMDVSAFFKKWFADLREAQGRDGAFPHVAPDVLGEGGVAGWGDAGVICPWIHYLCYGDLRILEDSYRSMKAWVGFMVKNSLNLVRPDHGFGDWVAVKAETPKDLIATAYFAHSTGLLARVAQVLGRKGDAARYRTLFERIKEAFGRAFITPAGRIVGSTQTSYVLALAFDLVPKGLKKAAADHLIREIEKREGHLSTGFIGTAHLLPVLTAAGRMDLAYRLVKNETYPSWGYTIKQGATTIWERWDGWRPEQGFQDPEMNSFNHYAFGAVGEWLYSVVGGVAPDPKAPGYRRIIIHPRPGGGITRARVEHESMHGPILSRWRLTKTRFELTAAIPPNTRATVRLPVVALKGVTEGGKPLARATGILKARKEGGECVMEVGAGRYHFASKLKD